ncbi:winged helix-turn-helix transcriptional regulator [Flavobacterium sp. HJSW_4]|uniref:winged helix-turn-helix transcriptional regulator n=1 Tax=Flavobacterium sp. HJSW_4 TaxID=3344660 RepID=UPI0035F279B6
MLYGKWKIRLLWFIDQGHKRPSELQRKIPDASRRVLNMQLKELEDHELVSKVIYPVMPPKVEYSLTDFGKTLIPVIAVIGNWGDEHEARLRSLILKRLESNH